MMWPGGIAPSKINEAARKEDWHSRWSPVLDAIMEALQDTNLNSAVGSLCYEYEGFNEGKVWAEVRKAVADVLLDRGIEREGQ